MALKQQELSKKELLRRLDDRSRSRYGEPVPESLFDDLQKDDLIPTLERSENDGLSPTYFATSRHYRRALQLQRLRSIEIKGRDALRVQLFVRGYGLKVSEVRGALRSEFLRGLQELRPQLRSQYFRRGDREPGPGHLGAVERQLDQIDPRFESAGLKQPTKFYLNHTRLGFGVLSRSFLAPLEGLLLAGLDDHPLPKLIEDALNASDDEYVSARAALTWMERTTFRPVVGRNFIDNPNWPTQVFVIILVLQRVQRSIGRFTVSSILGRVPSRDGFERLANRLLDKEADRKGRAAATNVGGNEKREK
jgi:hypothetical protein